MARWPTSATSVTPTRWCSATIARDLGCSGWQRRSTRRAPSIGGVVGRESERARLRTLLADGGALVVRGEPGVGKSTLLEQAVLDAGERRVLRATGLESESELAYAGL